MLECLNAFHHHYLFKGWILKFWVWELKRFENFRQIKYSTTFSIDIPRYFRGKMQKAGEQVWRHWRCDKILCVHKRLFLLTRTHLPLHTPELKLSVCKKIFNVSRRANVFVKIFSLSRSLARSRTYRTMRELWGKKNVLPKLGGKREGFSCTHSCVQERKKFFQAASWISLIFAALTETSQKFLSLAHNIHSRPPPLLSLSPPPPYNTHRVCQSLKNNYQKEFIHKKKDFNYAKLCVAREK